MGIVALTAGIAAAESSPASASLPASDPPPFVDGEVIVGIRGGGEKLLRLPSEVSVGEAARALGVNPRVAYALPNYIARAAAPNDPGRSGQPGGWRFMQWNFLPCGSFCGDPPRAFQSAGGIDALSAWRTLWRRGRPGARALKVAVLDTGIAYRRLGRKFRKSPDFARRQFIRGHDFVSGDRIALDHDGHGTHVAGTIAERTNNRRALTGLAHRARLVPVRVLNAGGFGTARDIARGIRFAARRGARVLNMSFEFSPGIRSCRRIRGVCRALKFATRRHRVVAVAAVGNGAIGAASFPARAPRVIGVGASTREGALAVYSNHGPGLDVVAPGGSDTGTSNCGDDPIFQLTFKRRGFRRFGFPCGYHGTSMASAHVAGAAAMVIASRVVGRRPAPWRVRCQLIQTARPLIPPGEAGLIDVGKAVAARASGC